MSPQPPVVDLSGSGRAHTHPLIDAACRDWGVFQVVGHGIDLRMMAALRRQMRALFGAPLEERLAFERTAANPWGYYDRELTRHTRDWKQVYDYGPTDGDDIVPQWPSRLPAVKPIVREYYQACNDVSLRLLRVMVRNLGMPAESLDAHFRPAHTSFLRLNYYPKCPAPNGRLGVNAHTDAGAITLLLQDMPGLEVFNDGRWHRVEPRHDALVVNIGDVLQVWSNDRYTAPLHRAVTHSQEDRFSAPFFFNPAYSTNYAPLPSAVDARHPPRYRPINWREFRARRAAGDYADAGEYAQTSQYSLQEN
jgi:isopenicillin N synthase-like dioxygenase